ncbi:MAG: S26 family signal peptidase [Caulobacteraceae bacterium]
MNPTALAVAAVGLAALAAPMLLRPAPVLLWNLTPSAPVGLYWARSPGRLRLGDYVAAMAPPKTAELFAGRGYLPLGVPLVKRIAALAPARVCRLGQAIVIDGRAVALAKVKDAQGRPLPTWRGCEILARSDVFLINAAKDSLDSRYFGPLSIRRIDARLTPVWIVGAPRP